MIKIDIDMPKSCYDCPFNSRIFGFDWCCIKIEYSWTETGDKPNWCPLIEVNDDKN